MTTCAVCAYDKPDCTLVEHEDDLPELACGECLTVRGQLRAAAQIWSTGRVETGQLAS